VVEEMVVSLDPEWVVVEVGAAVEEAEVDYHHPGHHHHLDGCHLDLDWLTPI